MRVRVYMSVTILSRRSLGLSTVTWAEGTEDSVFYSRCAGEGTGGWNGAAQTMAWVDPANGMSVVFVSQARL